MSRKGKTHTPFYAWLAQQVRRDDEIGDLARDARDDPRLPGHPHSLIPYLRTRNATPSVLAAAEYALREWRAER